MDDKEKKYEIRGTVPSRYILQPIQDNELILKYFNAYNTNGKENDDFSEINDKKYKIALLLLNTRNKKESKKNINVINEPFQTKIVGFIDKTINTPYFSLKNGNVVYFIEHPSGYIVPVTHDVIFESLYSNGAEKGAILKDKFIVATIGNKTKFIRENSGLYNACKYSYERKNAPKLSQREYLYGKIYTTNKDRKTLFLGKAATIFPMMDITYEDPKNNNWSIKNFRVIKEEYKHCSLWVDLGRIQQIKDIQGISNYYIDHGYLNIRRNDRYKIIEQDDINIEVPSFQYMLGKFCHTSMTRANDRYKDVSEHIEAAIEHNKKFDSGAYAKKYDMNWNILYSFMFVCHYASVQYWGFGINAIKPLKDFERILVPKIIELQNKYYSDKRISCF